MRKNSFLAPGSDLFLKAYKSCNQLDEGWWSWGVEKDLATPHILLGNLVSELESRPPELWVKARS